MIFVTTMFIFNQIFFPLEISEYSFNLLLLYFTRPMLMNKNSITKKKNVLRVAKNISRNAASPAETSWLD